MPEASEATQRLLAWGSICNYIDRISTIEEKIDGGWDELVEMVADTIVDNQDEKSTAALFADVFNFMYNLYFRLKKNPTKRDFNQVNKVKIGGKEVYRITNYDYKTFKWAKVNKLVDGKIHEDYLDVSTDNLTEKQRLALDRRCEKGDDK